MRKENSFAKKMITENGNKTCAEIAIAFGIDNEKVKTIIDNWDSKNYNDETKTEIEKTLQSAITNYIISKMMDGMII